MKASLLFAKTNPRLSPWQTIHPIKKKQEKKKKKNKSTRLFPVGVGIRAESPCLLTRDRHINRVLACGLRLFTSNQTSKKESSLLLKWTPLIRWVIRRTARPVWLGHVCDYLLNWPTCSLIGDRNENAFILPLCPYAARLRGDISSAKITSGIYPCFGMGE